MTRICILQNSMTYGGTDTFVINLTRGLVADSYDVTVVLSADEDEGLPRIAELESTGAQIVRTCHLRGVKSKLQHLYMLKKELSKGGYDVFQTNIDLFNGPQMFVSWLAGVPVRVCHSHNSEQGRELSQGRTFAIRVYQRGMRWLCWTFSNRRCGCSELAMNFLFEDRWRDDPSSRVVYNGIDLERFEVPVDDVIKRQELNLNKKYNILTVGRIDYQKNPLFLVEVFAEVCKLRADCDLVWVGKGEMEPEVLSKIEGFGISDRVHMLGARSDVEEIMSVCDLFLLPSRFEGFGIVLAEAQAAGLPCVASNVVPLESDFGLCSFLSLDLPPEQWAREISSILDGERELQINAETLSKCGTAHMVAQMEEMFS